jgi:hypothetical protein
MLQLTIPATEQWDEKNEQFITTKEQTLLLEHSLISLSKWESKWCKPFLGKKEKTFEETMDYIRCMCINDVDPEVLRYLTNENVSQINKYIEAPMTATTFSKDINNKQSREQVTAELVYYWMIALNIPFECENWHLNRLLTLIKVCNIKNAPPKKMSKSEISRRNAAINAARRKQYNTKG